MGFMTIAARRSGSVAERCTVADSEKLPCGGSSSITQADCEANNCCYDLNSSTSPCYYANDGEWFWVSEQRWQLLDIHACLLCPVTVQCTLDGQFVVVVSEKVTLPSLDLGSIQLVDSSSPNCSPVTSLSSFVLYQFPVSACGSTVQVILPVHLLGKPGCANSSYGSYYVDADYPVTKTLRDPVAVEVHIVNRTDPNLVLTLGDCWVTPGPSASSQPQWSLLVNGCPYAGDNYLTSLVTVDSTSGVAYPSHYKRFVFEMFAFVDPVARQALAEKVGVFVAKVNPALLFLWSCLKYSGWFQFEMGVWIHTSEVRSFLLCGFTICVPGFSL
ncbi:ZP4 protein, partial [Polypterus senegalus]